ncbi:hypothetical protein A3F28_02925 [Candidatus Uhrbacteria bacterium RIFCSPHIGHO2_12_FULL_57_11]|uniref:Multidrug resistance protein MdtA-like C-terminal permuted SH3 domain-containing protein n=2 Tax=Candidatus Uhriibacteriota TaxID=1752732 RepID=A0A1F7UM07_9BACT|nr:MAG: hypothetical protein A3D72_04575 [Candidatus Uhrbacteria bacterium RIFCSPHIGHO2_02_FULL_57_19]OGL79311.1 MAG: hypothetical protein A3F28_02925 [Candidatus Uhrbacteria bacterium RIFCSPHIGHO2_12_FULL_57_11]
MKRLLIIIILLLTAGAAAFFYLRRGPEIEYRFAEVRRGEVVAVVSVVGHVEPSEEIDLGFLNSGTIKEMRVRVGDRVAENDVLAALETRSFEIDRSAASARLRLAQAKLAQSKAGNPEEEIQVAQTAVANAQISLANARIKKDEAMVTLANAERTLTDVQSKAIDDLNKKYSDALETAKTAQTENDKAIRTLNDMQEKYFYGTVSLANEVKDAETAARNAFGPANDAVNAAVADPTQAKIDAALSSIRDSLAVIREKILILRTSMDDSTINASSADNTTVDTERAAVDTNLTNITTAITNISGQKVTNQKNINDAQSDVDSANAARRVAESAVTQAEGDLETAKDNLAVAQAGPREVDLALFRAEIDEARSDIAAIDKKISDAVLQAPMAGTITAVEGKVGEKPSAGATVVSLISINDFEIKADVSELDIASISIGDPVRTTFDAFGLEQSFSGKAVKIDPTEKIKEGDIYYIVTAVLDPTDSAIKPGMTADLAIETDRRDDTLFLPLRAVTTADGQSTVRVLQAGRIVERPVTVGLKSKDDIEILSGLSEGDQVILSVREL